MEWQERKAVEWLRTVRESTLKSGERIQREGERKLKTGVRKLNK